MALEYRVNPELDVPIYTQLIDMIRSDIINNRLAYGVKLPTVRDFSECCGVARGTVMRAYSDLEQQGYLEKIQGRGTFVSYKEDTGSSRKDSAMAAIDAMLDTLDSLNFSAAEAEIFLNLKLRERYADRCDVSVAVVDSCVETLLSAEEHLRSISGLEVYAYNLDDVLSYPYKITADTDIVIIPAENYEELAEVLPDAGKLAKSVLTLSPASVSAIARIPAGSRICILSKTAAFGKKLEKACCDYAPDCTCEAKLFSECDDPKAYDVLLVPGNYTRYCDGRTSGLIKDLTLIECSFAMDSGSFMYLSDRINAIRENKY